jgi:hypothetical protein
VVSRTQLSRAVWGSHVDEHGLDVAMARLRRNLATVGATIDTVPKRGLPVNFDQLTRVGDVELSPGQRYALKTHAVCAQLQDHVFMVRVRLPGGVLPARVGDPLEAEVEIHRRASELLAERTGPKGGSRPSR